MIVLSQLSSSHILEVLGRRTVQIDILHTYLQEEPIMYSISWVLTSVCWFNQHFCNLLYTVSQKTGSVSWTITAWSATKQRLHPQSVVEISRHSVLSGTGFDTVEHRLGLATRTQISVCKSPFPSAGTAVSLFRAKTVQQRPLLPRDVETHQFRSPGTETNHTFSRNRKSLACLPTETTPKVGFFPVSAQ